MRKRRRGRKEEGGNRGGRRGVEAVEGKVKDVKGTRKEKLRRSLEEKEREE